MKIKFEKGKVPDQTGFYLIGHNRGKDQFVCVEVVNWTGELYMIATDSHYGGTVAKYPDYYWSDKMEPEYE